MRTFIIDIIFLYQFIALCLFGYWIVHSTNIEIFSINSLGFLLCIASIYVNVINVKFIEGYKGIFYEPS